MTLTEKIISALVGAGIDARKPAAYQGECKAPYIVVRDGGARETTKTTCKRAVVLHGYAPYGSPAQLSAMLALAEAIMDTTPAPRLTEIGAEAVDDAYKAVTASRTYEALCAR